MNDTVANENKKNELLKKYQKILEKKRELLYEIEFLFEEYCTEDEYNFDYWHDPDSDKIYEHELNEEIKELEDNINSVKKDIKELKEILTNMNDDIHCFEGYLINDQDKNPYGHQDFYPFFKEQREQVKLHIDKIDKEEKDFQEKIEKIENEKKLLEEI